MQMGVNYIGTHRNYTRRLCGAAVPPPLAARLLFGDDEMKEISEMLRKAAEPVDGADLCFDVED